MTNQIYGRFQQKHDTEANWLKATNFAPLEGELIIYDADETHAYSRVKIGIWDGQSEKTNDMLVSNLPFVNMDPKDIEELLKNIECETLSVREADGDNVFSIAEGTRITGGSTNKDMITEMVGSLGALTVTLKEAQAHQDMSMAFGANSDTYGAGTVAFGVNTSAGTMAYYWDTITFGDKPTIQLSTTRRSSTQSNPSYPSTVDWAKGDRVTIKTKNTNWVLAGTIESVSGNVITLDAALPFTDIGYTSTLTVFIYAMPHDRTIHNIDKPESGVISIGFGAIAMGAGYENKTCAPGMLSLALGYETLAAGSFAFAGGHSSQAGYASIAFGNTAKALGEYSVAHGHYTKASGPASTALGYQTEASGQGSIALGYKTGATALGSFASGARAYSKATAAHALGVDCEARGYASTAEGSGTIAASSCQHVEGIGNEIDAEGKYAHIIGKGALGFTNDALDESKTVRANIHTVDWDGNAWYKGDVKAGDVGLKATNNIANTALITAQEAKKRTVLYYKDINLPDIYEGGALGLAAKETARYGAALGWGCKVTGAHGMAFGACTEAWAGQTAVGKANDPEKTYANGKTAIFMVGNGQTDTQANATVKSNAFAVTSDGIGYLGDKKILVEGDIMGTIKPTEILIEHNPGLSARVNISTDDYSGNIRLSNSIWGTGFTVDGYGTACFGTDENYGSGVKIYGFSGEIEADNSITASNYITASAGITEMYEWTDGNVNNEDRRGLFITLDGNKIRVANENDNYILGIIDPNPSLIGDAAGLEWKDKYLKDIFGSYIYEEVEVPATYDKEGNVLTEATIRKQKVLNPEYDETQEYISRTDRKEFAAITSKGKVVMIDDGTCIPNGYATVGANGQATYSSDNYAVRVLERIDKNHIKVLIDSIFIK